jgi:superkiller protein 3
MSPARVAIAALLLMVIGGTALRLYYFEPGIARTPDERTYTRDAQIVAALGVKGFQLLGQELAQNAPVVSLLPSPLRVGYITMLSWFMHLTHDFSLVAGARLSLLFSMLSLVLIAVYAYRFLSITAAIIATLFAAVFPFDLTIFRRTWEESFIALLTIACLLAAGYLVEAQRWSRYAWLAGIALLGFLCFTTKETSAIVFLLIAAGLLIHFLAAGDRMGALFTGCSAAGALAAYLCVLAWLFGGFSRSLGLVFAYAHYSGINSYSVQWDSGPLWMFPAGLLRTSPFLFVLALAGIGASVYGAVRGRSLKDVGARIGLALLVIVFLAIQLGAQRYSFRYTAPIFGPICLLAGIGTEKILPRLRELLSPVGRRTAWSILGFIIAIAAVHDLNFAYQRVFVPEIQDLAMRAILGVPPVPVASAADPPQQGNIASLEELARTNPTSENRITLSVAFIRANQPVSALPILNALVAEDPKNAVAWNNLCVAHNMLAEYPQAINACNKAIGIDPSFQLARNNLKWAQDEVAKAQQSVANAERSAPAARTSADYVAEGLNLMHIGNYDEAIKAWQRALAIDPHRALAANNIGAAYMSKGQPREALTWFQKALAIDPTLQVAKNNVAWASSELAKQGK